MTAPGEESCVCVCVCETQRQKEKVIDRQKLVKEVKLHGEGLQRKIGACEEVKGECNDLTLSWC